MAAAVVIVPRPYLNGVLLIEDGMIKNISIQISFFEKTVGRGLKEIGATSWKRRVIEKSINYPDPLPMSNSAMNSYLQEASSKKESGALTLARSQYCEKICGDASIAIHIEKQSQELERSLPEEIRHARRKTIVTYLGQRGHSYIKTYTETLDEDRKPYDTCGMCAAWETTARLIRNCSQCKITRYCSEFCRQLAWPAHKTVCHKEGEKPNHWV